MKRIAPLLFILTLLAVPALAQENQEKSVVFLPDYPAKISPGYTVAGARTLFYLDNIIPLVGNKDSLFFANPKIVLSSSHNANEQNVGCGYRQLLFDDNLLLGANFFYDSKDTKNDRRHHQLGFGAEAFITEWIDLRGNFYFPVSKKKRIGRNTSFGFGQRGIMAYNQDLFEEPLRGFDYEAGVLVPLVSNLMETRLYMGGYHYYSSLGPDINGLQARAEIRPTPNFVIDVQVNHDDITNTNAYFGMYVSLPLELGNLVRGKNPFEGWKDAIAFGKGARKPRERMTDVIVRDIDVVSQEAAGETTTTTACNMIYVDNSNDGDAAEDGSMAHPHNTLVEAFTNPLYGDGIVIYVKRGDGTTSGYDSGYTLAAGVTLWGDGCTYYGLGGNGYPTLTTNSGPTIQLGDNCTVRGCRIDNNGFGGFGPPIPVWAMDISGYTICNNIIQGASSDYGVYIYNTGSCSNINIINNTVTDPGISIKFNIDSGTTSNIKISGNTMSNGTNIYNAGICKDIAFTNNTASGNDAAFYAHCEAWAGGSTASFDGITLSGNSITTTNDGIVLRSGAVATATATISNLTIAGNTIINNTGDGIDLALDGSGGAESMTVDLGGGPYGSTGNNSIYGNAGGGFFDINNNSGVDNLPAQNNWWGQAGGPIGGQIGGANTVDSSNPLAFDPN